MRKILFALSLAMLMSMFFVIPTYAVSVELLGYRDLDWGPGNSPGLTSARSSWSEVVEMENIGYDSRIAVNGSYYVNYIPPYNPWNGVVWLWNSYGSYLQTTFTSASNSLFVQFESDSNDGLAAFYVDGNLVTTVDTYNGSWFAVLINDLSLSTHTLKVVSLGTGDLAIDAMGATVTCSTPEPAMMLLFSFGLVGLAAIRKKLKR